MEWSRAKANRVLPREGTGHSKHPLPATQEKTLHMDITRCSILKSDWLYSLQPKMEKLSTVTKNKTGSWLCLRSWIPYCQTQIKLKKVGKTTRPFKLKELFSCVQLFATHWTIQSMELSRPEYWSGWPFPSPGVLPNPGIDPGLPHCRLILYQQSHKGSPRILEWVVCPFSRGSSWNWTGISCTAGGFFTSWATREALMKQKFLK